MKKSYTKKQIVEAIKFWQRKLDEVASIDSIKIDVIDDASNIKKLLPAIVKLVVQTYKPIGGYYGSTDISRLSRTTSLAKVVKDSNDQVISCAFYRNIDGSFKLQAYGHDGSPEGKAGVKAIIKSDVAPYTNWVWGEVSGSVEKYFKKFEGYPLPNSLVADVLDKDSSKIELSEDGFHYKRKIANNDDATEKVIYGFKDKETADKVLALSAYEMARREFNEKSILNGISSLNESFIGKKLSFKGACSFVNQLSDMYDEEGIRQLPPQLSAVLDQSIEVLEDNINYAKWVQTTLDDAKYLRSHISSIELIANRL